MGGSPGRPLHLGIAGDGVRVDPADERGRHPPIVAASRATEVGGHARPRVPFHDGRRRSAPTPAASLKRKNYRGMGSSKPQVEQRRPGCAAAVSRRRWGSPPVEQRRLGWRLDARRRWLAARRRRRHARRRASTSATRRAATAVRRRRIGGSPSRITVGATPSVERRRRRRRGWRTAKHWHCDAVERGRQRVRRPCASPSWPTGPRRRSFASWTCSSRASSTRVMPCPSRP